METQGGSPDSTKVLRILNWNSSRARAYMEEKGPVRVVLRPWLIALQDKFIILPSQSCKNLHVLREFCLYKSHNCYLRVSILREFVWENINSMGMTVKLKLCTLQRLKTSWVSLCASVEWCRTRLKFQQQPMRFQLQTKGEDNEAERGSS